jgi:transposase
VNISQHCSALACQRVCSSRPPLRANGSQRYLEELGLEVIVADPNFASMYATRSRKVKTDRRDTRTLAEACRLGAYRPAHRTSDKQRHVRAQLAVREALVRTRSRYISIISTLVRRDGLRISSGHATSLPQAFGARSTIRRAQYGDCAARCAAANPE